MQKINTGTWVAVGVVAAAIIVGGWWWGEHPGGFSLQAGTEASSTPEGGQVGVVDRHADSVATIVANIAGASQYAGFFSSTGVGATVNKRGPYTIFVSTDKGFNLLPPGALSNMSAADKKRFVQYSIVYGHELDIDATNSGTVQALSGDALNFHVGPTGMAQVNSAFVLQEYKGSNGIVYVINQPLLPPVK